MNKPIIAVDFDDVIGHENYSIRTFMNRKYGFTHTHEDYLVPGRYWGYWKDIWELSPERAELAFELYLISHEREAMPILPDVGAVLQELKERFELVIVTSRGDHSVAATHQWLDRELPGLFSDVHFVSLWNGNKDTTKAEICQAIGAGYLIDDNPEHCDLAQAAGIQALLFGNYGWSVNHQPPEGVLRVKDWLAVKEFFDGIA